MIAHIIAHFGDLEPNKIDTSLLACKCPGSIEERNVSWINFTQNGPPISLIDKMIKWFLIREDQSDNIMAKKNTDA